ncbi:hypothetical protein MTO96_009031 [Rhipicephalus appendiculatus]
MDWFILDSFMRDWLNMEWYTIDWNNWRVPIPWFRRTNYYSETLQSGGQGTGKKHLRSNPGGCHPGCPRHPWRSSTGGSPPPHLLELWCTAAQSATNGYLRLHPGRLHTAVRVAAVLGTSLLAVGSLSVYVVKHKSDLFDSIAGRTFCCPEDAREAAKFVNASADPCHDFYTRVCAEGLRFKLWKQLARQTELEDVVTTGVVPKGVRVAKATRFLIGYYRSCIETIPNKADFVWELANQLAKATRELLVKPDPRNALIFAATTLLKYRLPSAIEIGLEPALIEPEEVAQLVEMVCHRFLSGNKKMAWRGTADVLKATLWNVVALRSVLADVGYDADEKTTSVRVKGVAGVLATHDSFAESGHDGARAAYLLLHSVASATHQMYETHHVVMTDDVVRRTCKASVQEIAEIWDMFTAEILATLDKENQLRAVFAAVKDAVYHDCAASAAFDDQDSARIGDFVQRLTLDVTMDAKRSAVAVPGVSRDLFAENLLRGRALRLLHPEGEAKRY